jgi:uncharacterized membrane protein
MNKAFKQIIWLAVAIPLIYLALAWKNLPDKIGIHFDMEGTFDKYGSRNDLLTSTIILTLVNIAVYLLVSNIYRIDPKKYAQENKIRLQRMAFVIAVFMSAVLCLLIYNGTHPEMKFGVKFIFAGTGLLLACIGNYIHTIKPNYFAGIRLPWTLENEDNWRRTHLLAGKLLFAGGLLVTVACLFIPTNMISIVFSIFIAVIVLIPCVYSYLLYRRQKKLSASK